MSGLDKILKLLVDTSDLVASANPICSHNGLVDEYAVPAEKLLKVLWAVEALAICPEVQGVASGEKEVGVN